MKVWHDDIRPAPLGWTWARTNEQAMKLLSENEVEEISLDHDLGLHNISEAQINLNEELLFLKGQDETTGVDLVEWMVGQDRVPAKITIHSWNPLGAERMASILNMAGHNCVVSPFKR